MGEQIRKKQKWVGEPHKINWDKITAVHYSFPPGSLEQDWREEALRYRETLKRIKKIVANENITGIETKLMIKDMLEGIE